MFSVMYSAFTSYHNTLVQKLNFSTTLTYYSTYYINTMLRLWFQAHMRPLQDQKYYSYRVSEESIKYSSPYNSWSSLPE